MTATLPSSCGFISVVSGCKNPAMFSGLPPVAMYACTRRHRLVLSSMKKPVICSVALVLSPSLTLRYFIWTKPMRRISAERVAMRATTSRRSRRSH